MEERMTAAERETFLGVLVGEHGENERRLAYRSCPPPLSSCSGFVFHYALFEHLGKAQMFDFDSCTEADCKG